jgi:hypothetical protein
VQRLTGSRFVPLLILLEPQLNAEAKLMLASGVTVLSNGFLAVMQITSTVPGQNDNSCGPIVDCL